MKKLVGIILLVFSIFLCGFIIIRDIGTERYDDVIISDEEYEDIISSREKSNGLLEGILFDEESLFYDKSNNTYYYSLVEGSASSKNPHIKLVAHNKLRIAFLNEKITEDIIKNNVSIKFIVYTGEYYCQYLLKCTTLPLMHILCSEGISDQKVEMNIILFDNRMNVPNRVIISDGTIHLRGASSRQLPKQGYRLALVQTSLGGHERNNHISLLGMRQDDDWLLYGAYDEPTKARNVFSCNLWQSSCAADNSIVSNTGMEYRYLELFINNEYCGLYALGFPIDSKQLNLQKGTGELYKKYTWATEASLEGYKTRAFGAENRDYLREFYEYLEKNKHDTDAVMEYVDINNIIDIRLFINLVQGRDHVGTTLYHRGQNSTYIKNIYLCIRDTDDGLIGLYSPWDLDMTWGSDPDENYLMETGYLEQMIANGDTDIIELMCNRYWTLRETYWADEKLMEMLDSIENDIFRSGAYLRDIERWPGGSYVENVGDGLSEFKNIVLSRMHEADLYYMRLEENLGKSYFVIRSLQYKDFKDYNFIVGIGDYNLLGESEYRELLEYIGIDVGQIDESVKFIAVSSKDEKVEYINQSVSVGDSMVTCAGTLYLNPEPVNKDNVSYVNDVYSVYVDDVFSFDTNDYLERDISLILIEDEGVEPFNFSKDFQLKGYENHLY